MNLNYQKPTPEFGENRLNLGMTYAILTVIMWGIIIAISKSFVSYFNLPPVLFTTMSFVYAALSLLLIAGFGRVGLQTFKSPYTWLYGMGRVLHLTLFNTSLLALTATESEFINRISVIFAVILTAIFLHKYPKKWEWFGLSLMLIAYLGFVVTQTSDTLWAILPVTLAAFMNAALAFIIQMHPISNQSAGVKERCRYTGAVLLVCSLFFLLTVSIVSFLLPPNPNYLILKGLYQIAYIPTGYPLLEFKLHAAALINGALLIGPVTYVTFYAIRLFGADNLLMLGTLTPFVALGIESILSTTGVLDSSTFSGLDLALGILITLGAIFTLLIRVSRPKEQS